MYGDNLSVLGNVNIRFVRLESGHLYSLLRMIADIKKPGAMAGLGAVC